MTQEKTKEDKLVDTIFNLPKKTLQEIRGNPEKVLKLIEDNAKELKLFMNVGPDKGKIIVDQIQRARPRILIELGCYLGYSAILFAKELRSIPGAKYYSFEINEYYAGIATRLIKLAGLSHIVEIIIGKSCDNLIRFRERIQPDYKYQAIDFIFIDHWKDIYVPDLRVLETLNLIAPGTIITADNIIYPGVPGYVAYVQGTPQYRKIHNLRVRNNNGKRFIGRWNLLYDSYTVEVVNSITDRKDAVEITTCIDYLAA